MSNNGNSKDDANPFSFEDDFGDMPGVTQLLNPKVLQEKAAAKKAKEAAAQASKPAPKPAEKPASPPPQTAKPASPAPEAKKSEEISIDLGGMEIESTSEAVSIAPVVAQASSSAKSLSELGVQFELQFEMERGVYRYTRMKPHEQPSLAMWQEKFYFQMKIDLATLGFQGGFKEFSKQEPFFEDAFGLVDAGFVQVVRVDGNTQKLFVLISNQTLAAHQNTLKDLLSGKSAADDGGDFKIELAS